MIDYFREKPEVGSSFINYKHCNWTGHWIWMLDHTRRHHPKVFNNQTDTTTDSTTTDINEAGISKRIGKD